MKKKIAFGVFHTTENGADYLVKSFKSRWEASDFEHANRDKFPRPLFIKKLVY